MFTLNRNALRLRARAMAASLLLLSTVAFAAGCSEKSPSDAAGPSAVKTVDPTSVPLPSNIPPEQQAQIRQQQAESYQRAMAQAGKGQPPQGKP